MAGILDLLNADEILNRQQQRRERKVRTMEGPPKNHGDLISNSHNQGPGLAQLHDHRSPRSIITPPPGYSWRRNSLANIDTCNVDPASSINSEGQVGSSISSINSSPIELGKVSNASILTKQELASNTNTVLSSVSPREPSSPSRIVATNMGLSSSSTTTIPPSSFNNNNNSSSFNSHKPLLQLRDKVPKSKINKRILANKRFVKFAIRRKYSTKKKISDTRQLKLHIKSLKAGIKIKLTRCDDLFTLYHCLIPFTDERKIYCLFNDEASTQEYNEIRVEWEESSDLKQQSNNNISKYLVSEGLQLIDNNVVDLNEYSNKIIKSFTSELSQASPTFNSLDTAVSTLFGTKDFTLVRITRSTTDDIHGSSILKLETAKPGDFTLIDDEENSDEMLHSLGGDGEVPNNLFFKKIIARPRYKSNMKIYFIPSAQVNYSLYTDCRSFERDLFNGVVQVEFEDLGKCLNDNAKNLDKVDVDDVRVRRVIGYERNVYCTFPIEDTLKRFKMSLIESLKGKAEGVEVDTLVSDVVVTQNTTTPPTQALPPPQFESPLDSQPIRNQVPPQQHQPVFSSLHSPQYQIPSSFQQRQQIPQSFSTRSLSFDDRFGSIRSQHYPFVNGISPQQRPSYPPPFSTVPRGSSIDIPHHMLVPQRQQQPIRPTVALHVATHTNDYIQLPPLVAVSQTPRSSIIKDEFTYSPVHLQEQGQKKVTYDSRILPPINTMPANSPQFQELSMPRDQYFHFQSRM